MMLRWCRWLLLGLAVLASAKRAAADEPLPVFTAEPTLGTHGEIRQAKLWEARTQLITELLAAAGFRAAIQPLPWRRAQDMAARGEGLLWGVSDTPERAADYALSDAVIAQPVWVVSWAEGNWQFQQLNDLRDKLVSIPIGARYHGEFEAAREHLFKVEQKSLSLASRLQMLARQRVDVVIFGSLRGTRAAAQSYVDCYYGKRGELLVSTLPLTRETLHLAGARGTAMAALMPRINQGLLSLRQRGRLQSLVEAFDTAALDDCAADGSR